MDLFSFHDKDLLDLITALTAIAAIILSIYNTWNQRRQTATLLKVIAEWDIVDVVKVTTYTLAGQSWDQDEYSGESYRLPAIEVINNSAFPITLKNVGYIVEDLGEFIVPLLNGKEYPFSLEARASIVARPIEIDQLAQVKHLIGKRIKKAFAETETGVREYSKGKCIRELNKMLSVDKDTDPKTIFQISKTHNK